MSDSSEDNRLTVAVTALRLEIIRGPQCGESFTITAFPCMLGRGGGSQVLLRDTDEPPTVSREHCTLVWERGQLLLRDHSLNGTQVGSRRLLQGETMRLMMPAEITLGSLVVMRITPNIANPFDGPPAQRVAAVLPPSPPLVKTTSPVGRLKERLCERPTLQQAWRKVELNHGAAGVDRVTIGDFARDADRRLEALRRALQRGAYEPVAPRMVALPKRGGAGVRAIAILTITDRIVQEALQAVLAPLIEPLLAPCAYAYRAGMSTHTALRAVEAALGRGLHWVAETDIADYFASISHRLLLEQLSTVVHEPLLLTVLAKCLAACAGAPGLGIAQGAATSPLFSNLYLAEFDRHMLDGGWCPVRYGDDMLFLCHARAQAQGALLEAEGFLSSRLALTLKPEKTAVVPLQAGFSFLSFRFDPGGRRATPEAEEALRRKVAEADPVAEVAVRRGWGNYFGKQALQMAEADAAAPMEPLEPLMEAAIPDDEDEPLTTAQEIPVAREAMAVRLLEYFVGREDAHAVHRLRQGKLRVLPCAGPLSAPLLLDHLAGKTTCALYPLCLDGSVRLLVVDIDTEPDAPDGEGARVTARDFALDFAHTAAAHGINAAIEDSGGKGYHAWIFFAEALTAEQARKLARLLLADTTAPRTHLRVEVFPRHSEWPGPELGDCIKLPFGVHVGSGRRTLLLDEEGEAIPDIDSALDTLIPVSTRQLRLAMKQLVARPGALPKRPSPTSPAGAVHAVLRQCAVLQALMARARETGQLRHTHRLILLYTLGRLGPEGAQTLHQAISACGNYTPPRTQSYLDKLDPSISPLTCRRIREWLEEDEQDAALCHCDSERRTPLDGILADAATTKRDRRRKDADTPTPASDVPDQWDDVRGALFQEEDAATGEAADSPHES